MKTIFCLILFFTTSHLFAQNKSDFNLIAQHDYQQFQANNTTHRHVSVFHSNSQNWLFSYNPISLFFKGSLFFYQSIVSPQISAQCLYSPSCSNFSKQSIQQYGLLKGILLSADRLLRCNRISALDISLASINDTTGISNDIPQLYSFKKK
jgi:putative membrane protein insertion efficiency factor